MSRTYPAKVLLFGEHTVLRGGQGLAVPYPRFGLRWAAGEPDERLSAFAAYLRREIPAWALNAGALDAFLRAGNRLDGNIPTGYGLGSSGAVCAAVWDRFGTDRGHALRGEELRKMLARMESHFHGTSSGTDPLICYLNRPVRLGDGDPPTSVSLPPDWRRSFFLVDTGRERSAATLIGKFTRRYDGDPAFARATDDHWRTPADACCTALRTGDRTALVRGMRAISAFQLRELPDFIPPGYHSRWLHDDYLLKICGAGGGGVLLGLARDPTVVEDTFGEVWWL